MGLHRVPCKVVCLFYVVATLSVAVAAASSHRVFYIAPVKGGPGKGGSAKFMGDLEAHYRHAATFIHLRSKATAAKAAAYMQKGDFLFLQHLLNTDFTFTHVSELVAQHGLRLVVPIHDLYFLNDIPAADHTLNESVHTYEAPSIPADKLQLLSMAEHIIFPSNFIHDVFAKHISFPSMAIVPHGDDRTPRHFDVPVVDNGNTLHVGIITSPSYTKGGDLMLRLMQACTSHNGKRVRFFWYGLSTQAARFISLLLLSRTLVGRGAYRESDIYGKLQQDKVQGLLFLNNHAETYSYALTKGINTGLPILYSDMGAVGERMRALGAPDKYIATTNLDVELRFRQLLDYIDTHAGRPQQSSGDGAAVACDDAARQAQPAFFDRLFLGGQAGDESWIDTA